MKIPEPMMDPTMIVHPWTSPRVFFKPPDSSSISSIWCFDLSLSILYLHLFLFLSGRFVWIVFLWSLSAWTPSQSLIIIHNEQQNRPSSNSPSSHSFPQWHNHPCRPFRPFSPEREHIQLIEEKAEKIHLAGKTQCCMLTVDLHFNISQKSAFCVCYKVTRCITKLPIAFKSDQLGFKVTSSVCKPWGYLQDYQQLGQAQVEVLGLGTWGYCQG